MILLLPSYNVEENMLLVGFLSSNEYVQDKIFRDPEKGITGIPNVVYDRYKQQISKSYAEQAWIQIADDRYIFVNLPVIYIMHDAVRLAKSNPQIKANIMSVFNKILFDYDFFLSYQNPSKRDSLKNLDLLLKENNETNKYHLGPIAYDILDNAFLSSILSDLNNIFFIVELSKIVKIEDIKMVASEIEKVSSLDSVSKFVGGLRLFYDTKVVENSKELI